MAKHIHIHLKDGAPPNNSAYEKANRMREAIQHAASGMRPVDTDQRGSIDDLRRAFKKIRDAAEAGLQLLD